MDRVSNTAVRQYSKDVRIAELLAYIAVLALLGTVAVWAAGSI